MRNVMVLGLSACVLLGLISQAFSNGKADHEADEGGVGIAVSPQTLLLGSDQGGWITVHTNIPYDRVNLGTLALNGEPVSRTKPDSRGELVAFFAEAAIKDFVAPPEATLTLAGDYTGGTAFAGSDTVRVIE